MGEKLESCRKETTITVRCTEKVKKQLKEKADKNGKSLSSYLLDAGIAGMESRKEGKKKKIKALVELTGSVNECYDYLQSENLEDGVLKEKLDSVVKGVDRLWGI